MLLTRELKPLAICLCIEFLLDTKRLKHEFCDNIFSVLKDERLKRDLYEVKKKLIFGKEDIFLSGYKFCLINLFDELVGILEKEFKPFNLSKTNQILQVCKNLISLIKDGDFKEIERSSKDFKVNVLFPLTELIKEKLKSKQIE